MRLYISNFAFLQYTKHDMFFFLYRQVEDASEISSIAQQVWGFFKSLFIMPGVKSSTPDGAFFFKVKLL